MSEVLNDRKQPLLCIVIPCYNEEEMLPITKERLLEKFERMKAAGLIAADSRILLVDDGSKDATWRLISAYHAENPVFQGLKLAHNRGHQNALLAGMMTAKSFCDVCISMDADLQDDIEVMDEFIAKYEEGCEIVYGVRNDRSTDTAFKRDSAMLFYHFMEKLGVTTVVNHADYRLMSIRALEALSEYDEVNLYLRGIIPQLGFKTDVVYYSRGERLAGETKYPLTKMISFALQGITSFSVKPLEFIAKLGIVISFLSFLALVAALVLVLCHQTAIAGVFGLIGSIYLLGGILLMAMGVVGIYVGKTYQESKRRPRYEIETYLN